MTPSITNSLDLAHVAYEAYCASLKEHRGMRPREWRDLPPHQQEAWEAAALAVKVCQFKNFGQGDPS